MCRHHRHHHHHHIRLLKVVKTQLNTDVYVSVLTNCHVWTVVTRWILFIQSDEASPIHHLIIDGLKGCWTPSNRSVVMKLYDSYSRAQRLKKSLSADAVHGFKLDASQTPQVCRDLKLHIFVLFSWLHSFSLAQIALSNLRKCSDRSDKSAKKNASDHSDCTLLFGHAHTTHNAVLI